MKVLIVAKSYNQASGARAMQMRRVIEALRTYTNISIILVTHGKKSDTSKTDDFEKINIESKFKTSRIKQRLFSGKSNFDKNFIDESIKTIDEILNNQKIDILLTVSTPIECHEIGLRIKKQNPELKWISFFSDLWPSHIVPKPLYRKKLGAKKDINFMNEVTQFSNILITPSKYTLDILRKKIPNLKARLETIPHTTREETIDKSKNKIKGYVIHSGFLQKERINEELVLAVKELEKEPLFKGLIHVGRYHPSLIKLIKKHNIKKIYLFGAVPEELAGSIQKMAEIAIIIEAPMRDISPFLPSKITDAILLSEKIVSISPKNSALANMSNKWPGLFTATYKKEEIVNIIKTALTSDEKIPFKLEEELSPKIIAEKYLKLFES